MSGLLGAKVLRLFRSNLFSPAVPAAIFHKILVPTVVQLSTEAPFLGSRMPDSNARVETNRSKVIPFLAVALLALATPSWASTYTATSCSASAVQTAINSAADGDTVLVPSANCPLTSPTTWNSAVTISKGIYFNGQGSSIVFGSGGSLVITQDSGHGELTENFNFKNGFTNGGCPITFVISAAAKPGRFTGNTYTDTTTGTGTTELCISGLGTLLIDHNTFATTAGADEVIHILGLGAGNDNWADSLTPGSPNMVYIETNIFTNNSGATGYVTSAEEAYYGAEWVFRDNTLNYEQNDMHGGDGGRWAEIYSNTYTFVTSGGQGCYPSFAQIRGGSGLFYSNHVTGSPGCSNPFPAFQFGPDCPGSSDTCSGTWPVPKQIGRGINETTYSPAYAWGNDLQIQSNVDAAGSQSLVAVGGSTGNCSGHPGSVCDAVATTLLPNLVRCQSAADVSAGCPVAYSYSAFAYPYPLTSDGLPNPTGQSASPGAPTNLQGTVP